MFEDKNNRTELSDLGEFGLIRHLSENIKIKNLESIIGIGDDAAVIDNDGKMTIVTTDMLVEGIHFDLTYIPLKHLGYKSAVVNFSDIYAMNAIPKQVVISIALSNRFSLEAVEEFYSGIILACEKYGVDIVGGDTSSSQKGFIISVTAIGQANKDDIVYRNGARVNDLVCVSGNLGAAYIGLQLLEREKSIYQGNPNIQPDLAGYDYVLERQLKPEARKDIIENFKESGIVPTSMIDISDGLSSEILHICESSNTGVSLYENKIPIDHSANQAAEELNLNPTVCALSGGEDYELLFTVPVKYFDTIKKWPEITIIGKIEEKNEGVNLITNAGSIVSITAQGWDNLFKK